MRGSSNCRSSTCNSCRPSSSHSHRHRCHHLPIDCQIIKILSHTDNLALNFPQFPARLRLRAAILAIAATRTSRHKRVCSLYFLPHVAHHQRHRRCNADRRLPRKSKQSRRAAAQRWRASCLPLLPSIVTPPSWTAIRLHSLSSSSPLLFDALGFRLPERITSEVAKKVLRSYVSTLFAGGRESKCIDSYIGFQAYISPRQRPSRGTYVVTHTRSQKPLDADRRRNNDAFSMPLMTP